MPRPLVLVLPLVAVALAACGADDDAAEEGATRTDTTAIEKDTGDFLLRLERGKREDEGIREFVKEQEPEVLVEGLNENFRLPRDIPIVFRSLRKSDEGDTSPYYDPERPAVHVPYDFVAETVAVFEETGSSEDDAFEEAIDTTEFVIYHEIGHALVDVLDLPVTGREEDAVDGLATAVLTAAVEEGSETVLTAADWFSALSELGGDELGVEQFADEHSLDDQRFFNLLCWVYGSDPDKYADLVEDGDLPEDRALACPDEYIQNVESWVELLEPWLKD